MSQWNNELNGESMILSKTLYFFPSCFLCSCPDAYPTTPKKSCLRFSSSTNDFNLFPVPLKRIYESKPKRASVAVEIHINQPSHISLHEQTANKFSLSFHEINSRILQTKCQRSYSQE